MSPWSPEKEGMLVCVCVRLCTWNTATHNLGEKKKWAKTDRDKQINRRIEIDRLTARRGKIRERRHELERAQKWRDEDSGRQVFKEKKNLIRTCTYTHTHTQLQRGVIDRDRQTSPQTEKRMSGKRVTEGKGKTERDAVIRSHIQIETDSRETNKKTDSRTDGVTVTSCICLFVSSVALLNTSWPTGSVTNVVFSPQCTSTAVNHEEKRYTRAVCRFGNSQCLVMSVFFAGKSSAAQEMMHFLFVCFE